MFADPDLVKVDAVLKFRGAGFFSMGNGISWLEGATAENRRQLTETSQGASPS